MTDRFFLNDMPRFVEETEGVAATMTNSTLLNLLHLPYPQLADKLLAAALDLKDKVVEETWVSTGRRVDDYTLYTGGLGTAFLLFKAYQVTGDASDLTLCAEIVRACDEASKGSTDVTFICGRAGVCTLGAVAAKHSGNEELMNRYLSSFREIKMPRDVPNEILYGRAGYLWACLFLNKHIGDGTITSSDMNSSVRNIIMDGEKLASKGRCPLMYEFYDERYWGAAHGLAGIMQVLMNTSLKKEEEDLVKGTLLYMIRNRFPSGNYRPSEDDDEDRLVHWCHGAPGIAMTLAKAAQIYNEQRFLQAAIDAAEVVWNRGLLKRLGICHGVSGNAYVFLSLYRLTGNVEYLYRAKAFACFLLDRAGQLIADGTMHGGDQPFSMFEGKAGMAYLFLDMIKPAESRFPAYEL